MAMKQLNAVVRKGPGGSVCCRLRHGALARCAMADGDCTEVSVWPGVLKSDAPSREQRAASPIKQLCVAILKKGR